MDSIRPYDEMLCVSFSIYGNGSGQNYHSQRSAHVLQVKMTYSERTHACTQHWGSHRATCVPSHTATYTRFIEMTSWMFWTCTQSFTRPSRATWRSPSTCGTWVLCIMQSYCMTNCGYTTLLKCTLFLIACYWTWLRDVVTVTYWFPY
jgi:hypothetical protein